MKLEYQVHLSKSNAAGSNGSFPRRLFWKATHFDAYGCIHWKCSFTTLWPAFCMLQVASNSISSESQYEPIRESWIKNIFFNSKPCIKLHNGADAVPCSVSTKMMKRGSFVLWSSTRAFDRHCAEQQWGWKEEVISECVPPWHSIFGIAPHVVLQSPFFSMSVYWPKVQDNRLSDNIPLTQYDTDSPAWQPISII